MEEYMKKQLNPLLTTVGLVFILVSTATLSLASHHEDGTTTSGDVKQETAEAYHTVLNFTVEQRDEAVADARKKLDKLDTRIDAMQNSLDKRWHKMTEAAQQKQQAALKTLREKRNEVAEWYGGLHHSSADAWDRVKKGFSDSYDRLEEAFDNARKEFEDNNGMKKQQ
jgi:TolA-binding protein